MSDGVVVELNELIALRRYAIASRYRSEGRASRFGSNLSRIRGRGMDFAEVRNYQAGDEIRHMEWRVTARTGRPHVKLYQEERERPVIILTDFSPSMYFGTRVAFKSAVAARLAALLAWTALKQGDRVGGLLVSDKAHHEFPPSLRESKVLPYLAALSQCTREVYPSFDTNRAATWSLSNSLQKLRRVTKPGSFLMLIGDFYSLNEDSEQHLSQLCRHNDVIAYHLCDPLELAPPKPAQYAITNGQKDVLLDTRIDTVRFAYQHYCEQRVALLKARLQRLQIPYIQVLAESDLPHLVRMTFPKGGGFA